MVCVDPGLRARDAVGREEEDDVLGPERPALEVTGEGENEGHAAAVEFPIDVFPGGDEDNGFGGVAARGLEDRVDVLAGMGVAGGTVGEVLTANFQTEAFGNRFEFVVDPEFCKLMLARFPTRPKPNEGGRWTYSMFPLPASSSVSCLYARKTF